MAIQSADTSAQFVEIHNYSVPGRHDNVLNRCDGEGPSGQIEALPSESCVWPIHLVFPGLTSIEVAVIWY
jgi:hypothetical protein